MLLIQRHLVRFHEEALLFVGRQLDAEYCWHGFLRVLTVGKQRILRFVHLVMAQAEAGEKYLIIVVKFALSFVAFCH